MTAMSAGWFIDPTGRFAQRYFDGQDWTDQVQGANGQVMSDPMERRSTGFAAPVPPATVAPQFAPVGAPSAWGGPPPAWGGPQAPGPQQPKLGLSKGSGVAGLVIAGFGWLLVALSMFGADWLDGVTRTDISDALPDSIPDGLPLGDAFAFTYVSWLGLALLVIVAIGIVAVVFTLLGKDSTAPRFAVGLVAAVGAVAHAVAITQFLRDNAELGAYLGALGYLVVIAGLAIGSRSRRTA